MDQPSHPTPAGGSRPRTASSTASQANADASAADGPLLDQAKELLSKDSLDDALDQLPQSVKDAGSKLVSGFNKLSTTEKIVGGLLFVLGARYLTRGSKAQKSDKQADTLHELLLFVNDRVEGYKKATAESQDAQLRGYYKQLTSQSQQFANELNDHLRRLGDERETGTTLKGKLYRRLMEATAKVTGHDEKAILATNIHGEQWALAAYEEALDEDTLAGSLRLAVARQRAQSQKTYQELKKLAARQQ